MASSFTELHPGCLAETLLLAVMQVGKRSRMSLQEKTKLCVDLLLFPYLSPLFSPCPWIFPFFHLNALYMQFLE